MPDFRRAALMIAVIAAVTILLRFIPFLVFGGKRKTPEIINYLGKVLPCAIMGMLVVFCLKNVSIINADYLNYDFQYITPYLPIGKVIDFSEPL